MAQMFDFILREILAELYPEKNPSSQVWRRIQVQIRVAPTQRRPNFLRGAAHALRRHLEEGVWRPIARPLLLHSPGVYQPDMWVPDLAYTERQTLIALWCLSRAVPGHSF